MEKDPKRNNNNLSGQAAIDKLKELIKSESICHFCTQLTQQPIASRPMTTQRVDGDGNIWFFSSIKSDKNVEIEKNNQVQLFYSNPSSYEFLSIYGSATIHTDKEKIDEMWTPLANAWFKDGKDDADISLIKIRPQSSYYWDTKNNKMISMVQVFISKVTGGAPDDREEGTVDLN
ncbi:pyridoxamine 5'-phosphate oxidase family protein [Flavobacterium sp. ACAM 123]|jgi:general stress protein 26|uniref:pyridoxamine 5'-phosphate oxidase family protein n=1 Tax=Flavobacterium sp. ACAM 123 TaxID=1189620 RepID=UPI0002DD0959|nr:pyridoxamine 5'-phosphate oxidase family protein [Flavobacterium sp. ACAM 123]